MHQIYNLGVGIERLTLKEVICTLSVEREREQDGEIYLKRGNIKEEC